MGFADVTADATGGTGVYQGYTFGWIQNNGWVWTPMMAMGTVSHVNGYYLGLTIAVKVWDSSGACDVSDPFVF